MHLSFDDAANQEYVNAQEQDGWGQQPTFQTQGFGNKIKQNTEADFGDQTPVGSLLGADEVNNDE